MFRGCGEDRNSVVLYLNEDVYRRLAFLDLFEEFGVVCVFGRKFREFFCKFDEELNLVLIAQVKKIVAGFSKCSRKLSHDESIFSGISQAKRMGANRS